MPVGPYHIAQSLGASIQKWNGTDTEERFAQNCADQKTFKELENLRWIEPTRGPGWVAVELLYKFNTEGFRDDEFDQQPSGLALGCSHTQGVGIHSSDTWPKQLEKMLGQKVWNLGVNGSSLDTCYRFLEYWIDHLDIKFVVCAVPEILRFEVLVGQNPCWQSILPSVNKQQGLFDKVNWLENYVKHWVTHDQTSELNRRKNLLAMQAICDKHNVPFYYDLLEDFRDGSCARDFQHCGPSANHALAEKFANKIYNTQGKI